jgi:TolA-binding protein
MRNLIRVVVGAALCAALAASAAVPVPEDLPAVALKQEALYRLEVALLVFYGSLLLVTPAFSGLIHGRLPIEISTRGAKFAKEDERSVELTSAKVNELQRAVNALAEKLITAHGEIEQLKVMIGDSSQRGVDSKR